MNFDLDSPPHYYTVRYVQNYQNLNFAEKTGCGASTNESMKINTKKIKVNLSAQQKRT